MNKKEWYYIIKGRSEYGWIDLLKDKVFAETKEKAKEKINSEFDKNFPMRILGKNVKPESLLLKLYEIKDGEYSFVKKMFEERICKECKLKFDFIKQYNMGLYSSYEFCSITCKAKWYNKNKIFDSDNFNSSLPVIYKITQKSTGLMYIGQTIRSFTLRWWEHIKSLDNNKFHLALQNSDLTDWIFEIIEVLNKESDLTERERFWINHYDSVDNGLNSI